MRGGSERKEARQSLRRETYFNLVLWGECSILQKMAPFGGEKKTRVGAPPSLINRSMS